jgi:hypothetical protein
MFVALFLLRDDCFPFRRDNVTNVPKYTTNGKPIGAHKRFGERSSEFQ